jgi:hypothetical protein
MDSTNPEQQSGKDGAHAGPPRQNATVDDLADLDFEAPIAAAETADCEDLAAPFGAAVQRAGDPTINTDTAANRVFSMLAALAGLQLRPTDVNEPFKPLIVWSDGRRSSAPSDFRGPLLEVIAVMAEGARNPVLRARLADVVWLLDRKRGKHGILAIASYVEVIERVDRGELRFRGDNDAGALHHDVRRHLRRAMQIGRATGWDKAESVRARKLAIELRLRAVE